jgi:hypothetical protein
MSRLNKYLQTGGVIAENNEWVKTNDGNVAKIKNAPIHDDPVLYNGEDYISTPKNKGGIFLNNVESVLSATHDNRNSKDKTYSYKDEEIKVKPDEAKIIADYVGLNIKVDKGISPSKLLDKLVESKQKYLEKYRNIKYSNKIEGINSLRANSAVINSLPTDEELYNIVFQNQQNSKSEEIEEIAQLGTNKEYTNRFNWISTYDKEPFSIKEYGDTQQYPFDNKNISGMFIPSEKHKDNIYLNTLSEDKDIPKTINHESIHRNQYFRGERISDMNNNIFNELSNTPPYNQDVYDSFGNAEEIEAYLNTDDNRPEIDNFLKDRNKTRFLNRIINQQGGNGLTDNFLDSLNYPQKKLMSLFTDIPDITPSELMNIRADYYPESWNNRLRKNYPILHKTMGLGLDLVLDPLNVVPLTKAKYFKNLKGIEKIPLKTIEKAGNIVYGADKLDDSYDTFKTMSKQTGTQKGKLQIYPSEVTNKPQVVLNNGKIVGIDILDDQVYDRDPLTRYNQDSVIVNKNSLGKTVAKTFYNSKLKKYIK